MARHISASGTTHSQPPSSFIEPTDASGMVVSVWVNKGMRTKRLILREVPFARQQTQRASLSCKKINPAVIPLMLAYFYVVLSINVSSLRNVCASLLSYKRMLPEASSRSCDAVLQSIDKSSAGGTAPSSTYSSGVCTNIPLFFTSYFPSLPVPHSCLPLLRVSLLPSLSSYPSSPPFQSIPFPLRSSL